ncbi:hypothetical protein B0H67DRAFT_649843 [Lasiosphaeris hirsuta]|uniref:Uncharacterized protein n=1 Tax=Lasiosphaeris hirsuta TaxID=260670 RepID=A0AA39ZXP8_9PEZI|nr:hypothetical protein B0H67DRAFT_649843 [Lasiosphaeris hirsuta]
MEATVALGLAGNITQFLDFGLKLCKTVSEIYRSGTGITKYNAETEALTKNFAFGLDNLSGDLTKYYAYLATA